jgi:hypothetical protein
VVTIHNDRPPAAKPDRSGPKVTLRGVGRRLSRRRFLAGLRAVVRTNEAAALDVKLLAVARRAAISRTGDLALAHRRFASARGTRVLRIRPSRALVGGARRFRVRLRILATDTAGNRRTLTRTIRVR